MSTHSAESAILASTSDSPPIDISGGVLRYYSTEVSNLLRKNWFTSRLATIGTLQALNTARTYNETARVLSAGIVNALSALENGHNGLSIEVDHVNGQNIIVAEFTSDYGQIVERVPVSLNRWLTVENSAFGQSVVETNTGMGNFPGVITDMRMINEALMSGARQRAQ